MCLGDMQRGVIVYKGKINLQDHEYSEWNFDPILTYCSQLTDQSVFCNDNAGGSNTSEFGPHYLLRSFQDHYSDSAVPV